MNRGLRLPVFLSTYNMSKKIKKLTLQYAYMQIELEEVKEVCLKVEKEMREYMEKYHPQEYKAFYDPPIEPITSEEIKPENIDKEEDSEDHPLPPSPSKNKDLKTLYRKIAEKTHPDKTGDNQYTATFSKAAEAYADNDLATLLDLAGRLNIELLELSESSIALLEQNVKKLAMEIHQRKQTSAWAWSQCKSDEEKDSIIQQIIAMKGF